MSSPVNPTRLSPTRARSLAGSLVDWYGEYSRDLPWRQSREPYAVWVSEVMLQQTRVEVVIPRYESFLRRFPTLERLAAADASEVLAEWAGLGYYRRARQLHAAAIQLVKQEGGKFPRRAAALRLLPGFGQYTAGAVASIAFGEAVPAVDGNVERVLSRLFALEGDPKKGEAAAVIREAATGLVSQADPAQLNQALMELGALICAPRQPICDECPWGSHCAARRSGQPTAFPRKAPRPPVLQVSSYAAIVRESGRFLLRRRPEGLRNAGLWEFPTTEWHGGDPAPKDARRELARLGGAAGQAWEAGEALCEVRHSITRHRIRCVAHRVQGATVPPSDGWCWATEAEARALGLSAASRKIFEKLPSLI